MQSPDFDFSYMATLRHSMAGQGRIHFGNAVNEGDGQPVLVFVHGGYHGAWCFAHYLRYLDRLGIPAVAIDLRGHGGLRQTPDLFKQGVYDFAEDVVACCKALSGPPIPVGHSAGALICAAAGEMTRFHGFGLLAPSPPGQLLGLKKLPLVQSQGLIEPPGSKMCREKFLNGEHVHDITPFLERLCPESPKLLNDRRSLAIRIDQKHFGMPALCISAGRDRGALHPDGQDLAAAQFFGAEYHCLEAAPHCMMISAKWRTSADIIADWYQRTIHDQGARADKT